MINKTRVRKLSKTLNEKEWVNEAIITWYKNPEYTNMKNRFLLQDIILKLDNPYNHIDSVKDIIRQSGLLLKPRICRIEYITGDMSRKVIKIDVR